VETIDQDSETIDIPPGKPLERIGNLRNRKEASGVDAKSISHFKAARQRWSVT
jgi:hypothetical protein